MLELALVSLFTVLPDYLFRRYWQGKRIGYELTQYSIWFELRWGITACLMLTVILITIIFYYHPSTKTAAPLFRTVAILPETNGRVSEIYVKWRDKIEKGKPIFKLDSTKQEADLELAKRRIVEVDAAMVMAQADIAAAEGKIIEAKGALQQAQDELDTKQELDSATPASSPSGRSSGSPHCLKRARARLPVPTPPSRRRRRGSRRCCRRKRPAPTPPSSRHRSSWTKWLSTPGSPAAWSSSHCSVGDIVNPFMRPAGLLIPAEGGPPS